MSKVTGIDPPASVADEEEREYMILDCKLTFENVAARGSQNDHEKRENDQDNETTVGITSKREATATSPPMIHPTVVSVPLDAASPASSAASSFPSSHDDTKSDDFLSLVPEDVDESILDQLHIDDDCEEMTECHPVRKEQQKYEVRPRIVVETVEDDKEAEAEDHFITPTRKEPPRRLSLSSPGTTMEPLQRCDPTCAQEDEPHATMAPVERAVLDSNYHDFSTASAESSPALIATSRIAAPAVAARSSTDYSDQRENNPTEGTNEEQEGTTTSTTTATIHQKKYDWWRLMLWIVGVVGLITLLLPALILQPTGSSVKQLNQNQSDDTVIATGTTKFIVNTNVPARTSALDSDQTTSTKTLSFDDHAVTASIFQTHGSAIKDEGGSFMNDEIHVRNATTASAGGHVVVADKEVDKDDYACNSSSSSTDLIIPNNTLSFVFSAMSPEITKEITQDELDCENDDQEYILEGHDRAAVNALSDRDQSTTKKDVHIKTALDDDAKENVMNPAELMVKMPSVVVGTARKVSTIGLSKTVTAASIVGICRSFPYWIWFLPITFVVFISSKSIKNICAVDHDHVSTAGSTLQHRSHQLSKDHSYLAGAASLFDETMHLISLRLQRKGRRSGLSAKHCFSFDPKQYERLTSSDLELILCEGFNRAIQSHYNKAELITLVGKEYSAALDRMNMHDLQTYLRRRNLDVPAKMRKGQLIKIAVEAGL